MPSESQPKEKKILYTTILHDIRERLNLSLNEYCITDSIHKMSHRKDYSWCYESKKNLGKFIGVSERATHKIIRKLLFMNILEKEPSGSGLRTTEIWSNSTEFVNHEQSAVPMNKVQYPMNKVQSNHEQSADNSNTSNIINVNVKSEILKKTEKKGNVKITEAQKEQLSYELEKIGCEHSLGNWIKLCGIKGFSECLREIVSVRDAPNVKNRGAMAHFFAKSLPDLVPQSSNASTK